MQAYDHEAMQTAVLVHVITLQLPVDGLCTYQASCSL